MSRRSHKYSGLWAAMALAAVLLGLTPAFAAPPVVTLLSPADLASTVNPFMSLSADVSGTSPTTARIYGGTSSPPTGLLFVREGITTNQTLTYTWRDVVLGTDANTMGLWHLDDGTGVSATDASANGNTGTLQNGAAWTQSGRFAYALDLDGTNDYLSVADAASLDISASTGKITIEMWVYPRVLAGGYRTLLGKFQSASLINYQVSMDATNHLLFYTPAGGIKTSAIILPVNEWSYIAVTLDAADGLVRFYRNGVAGTPISGGAFGAPNTGALVIGQNGNNTEWINGLIDEVRVSNRILTAAEIAAHYGLANGTYYWQVKADDGINPLVESAIRSFTRAPDTDPPAITLLAPSDGAVTANPYMTLDATVSDATPPMTVWIYGDTQSDPTTLLQVEDNVASLASVTFDWSASVLQPESPYTMGLWHVDEGTGAATADASGNGNGGTLLNGAAWTTDGRFGHALNLDGTNDYVSIPDNANGSLDIDSLSGALTIEMWVRPDIVAGRYRTLLGKYAGSSQINYQISVDATNHLLFYSGKFANVPPGIWVSDVVLPVGEWSYIAVTMQATSGVGTVRFYRNGVEGTPMTGAYFAPANNGALVIGQNGANTTEFWDGLIDEVRLTRRVLDATEIAANYTLGDGTYRWKVTARDAASNSVTSGIRDFTVGAGAPDIPVLLLPLDASLTTDNTPTFVWSSTAGEGGSYKLQYSTSSDFSSGVVTSGGITDTTFPVASGQELANGTWYWHVQAINAAADSSGYQASAFQLVVNAPTELDPPVATLVTPAQGATIVTDHALLSTSVSDASPPMTVWIYGDRSTDPTHLLEVEDGVTDLATVSHDWSASALEPEAPYTMGLWRFDGGGTTASDESGNDNTGSFAGTPTWSTAGRLGYALDFGGAAEGDYVRIPDDPSLDVAAGTGAFTIEAWVYPRSAGGGVYRSILAKRGFGSGGGPCNYQISLNNTNGNLLFYNGTAVYASAVNIPAGVWSHVAVTLDATVGRLRFYRNGSLLDSASGVNFGSANDSGLYIGVANQVAECFDGLIDEVRLTGRVLSPTEIAANHRLDPDTYYWKVVAQDSWATQTTSPVRSFNTITDADPPAITQDAPADGVLLTVSHASLQTTVTDPSPPMTVWIYGDQTADPATLLHVATGLANPTTLIHEWNARPFTPDPTHNMGVWHCDDGTGTTTSDAGAFGNHGTFFGDPAWAVGRFGYAVDLDGTGDYLEVPDHASLDIDSATGALSMAAWVYPRVSGGDEVWRTILAKKAMGGVGVNYQMSLDKTTGNLLFFSGHYPEIWISSVHVPVGEWSYVAITLDALEGRLRFYRNGAALDSTAAAGAWFGPAHDGALHVGVSGSVSECFNGLIDEVCLVRRVLTAQEIAAWYKLGEGVHRWKVTASDTYGRTITEGPVSFTVDAEPPEAPILIAPADLAVTADNTPRFDWSRTAGAGGSYTLQYATNSSFTAGLVTVSDLTDTTFTVAPGNQLANGTWYWHVQARDLADHASGYQAVPFSFTVDTQPPGVPALIAPPDLVVIADNTPRFDWSRTAGTGGSYTLQYATNSNFTTGLVTVPDLTDTSFVVAGGNELANGTWYWRVQARDLAGNPSGYQAVPFSFVVDTQPPPVPTLRAPADLAVITDNTPRFDWSRTAGTGGSYTLEYAANSNFTAGVVTVPSLTDTTFTVAASHELANGTWYWHVQARDLAGNWSGYQLVPFSFTVVTADADPPEITLLEPPDESLVPENHAELQASVSDASPSMSVWLYGGTSPGGMQLYEALTGLGSPSTIAYDWAGSVLEAESPYTMGLWHFDDNAGTVVADVSGNGNDGSFSGSPDWTAAGKFGYALDLDGISDYVTVPDAASLDIDSATGKLTIEAWIRPDAVGGGDWKKILSKRQLGGEFTNYEMVINDVTGTLTFYNGRMPQIYVSTVYVPPGQWSYLAISLDAAEGMLRFYRNGRKLDSIPGAVFGGANTYPLTIGTGSSTAHCVDGLLDEVRLSRRVLSPWEILGNYCLDSGQYFWKVVAQDNLGNRDTSETWSFFAEPPPFDLDAPEITLLAPANGSWTMDPFADLSALVSDATPSLARIYGSMNPDPQELLYSEGGLVGAQMLDFHWAGRPFVTEPGVTAGLWHLNEGTGTTTADVSGNGLTGTLVNGPVWVPGGRFGAALSFDGTNDYVNVPHHANLSVDSATGALTMEAWVYPDVSGGDGIWRTILSKSNMGSAAVNYRMSLDRVTGNLLFYSGRYPEIWISSVHVPAGEWSYVAVSLSAAEGKVRFYRNGLALDSTAAGSAWFGPALTSEFHIGVSMATAECFDGLIDEVRITRRVLTSAEIAKHMELGDGVYYWKVTATDSMGNAATAGPWSFLINTAPAPPIPELRLPAHLALLTDATPQMVWIATAGAGGHYMLEYALDAGFSSGKVTVSGLTDSVYTPPSALADNTWYWHVQATSSLGTPSGYQTPYAFTLDTQAPAVPTLKLPVHLALLTDNTPTLVWSRENGALYTVQYSQDPGFALGVVTQSGLSDTTYAVPGGMQLSDGVWYWRVQATDQAGNPSGYQFTPFSFTVDTQAPAVPVLATPADLALITDNTPAFTWTATAGTGGTYRLQVDVTPLFTASVTISGITTNAYTMPVPMGDGDYYWHVEAVDLAGHPSGFQTAPFRFTLDAGMPSAPMLLTPPNNSFTCDATPTFTWTPSVTLALARDATAITAVAAAASTYTLQLSGDSTFAQPTTVAGLVETFYTPQVPMDQTVCYWRVQALDLAGNPSGYQASPFRLWFFNPGDMDLSGVVNSADIIRLVNFVFKGGTDPLPCEAAGDVNCDLKVTSADIIRLVNFVFKGGEPPCDLGSLITNGDWNCP